MSESKCSKSRPNRAGIPRAPLDAVLADAVGDPIRRALWLDALDLRLRPCLSLPLAAHARLANVVGDKLVFVVDAPVWRAKLRLAAPELLRTARSLGLDVSEFVVKSTTLPLTYPSQRTARTTPISAAASEALQAALASLKDLDHSKS